MHICCDGLSLLQITQLELELLKEYIINFNGHYGMSYGLNQYGTYTCVSARVGAILEYPATHLNIFIERVIWKQKVPFIFNEMQITGWVCYSWAAKLLLSPEIMFFFFSSLLGHWFTIMLDTAQGTGIILLILFVNREGHAIHFHAHCV